MLPYTQIIGRGVEVEYEGEWWKASVLEKGTTEEKLRVQFEDSTELDISAEDVPSRLRRGGGDAAVWKAWLQEVCSAPCPTRVKLLRCLHNFCAHRVRNDQITLLALVQFKHSRRRSKALNERSRSLSLLLKLE